MDGAAFTTWVQTQLAPALAPGTVFVGYLIHWIKSFSSSLLDNLSTHKVSAAAQALRQAGCWFLFLPPYSPDLNPIEVAFAKLKAHLRRIGARTFDHLVAALGDVCEMFTPDECRNYLQHAEYAST